MFHWICPECGREIPPKLKECPSCDPATVVPEALVSNAPEAVSLDAPKAVADHAPAAVTHNTSEGSTHNSGEPVTVDAPKAAADNTAETLSEEPAPAASAAAEAIGNVAAVAATEAPAPDAAPNAPADPAEVQTAIRAAEAIELAGPASEHPDTQDPAIVEPETTRAAAQAACPVEPAQPDSNDAIRSNSVAEASPEPALPTSPAASADSAAAQLLAAGPVDPSPAAPQQKPSTEHLEFVATGPAEPPADLAATRRLPIPLAIRQLRAAGTPGPTESAAEPSLGPAPSPDPAQDPLLALAQQIRDAQTQPAFSFTDAAPLSKPAQVEQTEPPHASIEVAVRDVAPEDVAPIDVAPIDVAPIDVAPIDVAPEHVTPEHPAPAPVVPERAGPQPPPVPDEPVPAAVATPVAVPSEPPSRVNPRLSPDDAVTEEIFLPPVLARLAASIGASEPRPTAPEPVSPASVANGSPSSYNARHIEQPVEQHIGHPVVQTNAALDMERASEPVAQYSPASAAEPATASRATGPLLLTSAPSESVAPIEPSLQVESQTQVEPEPAYREQPSLAADAGALALLGNTVMLAPPEAAPAPLEAAPIQAPPEPVASTTQTATLLAAPQPPITGPASPDDPASAKAPSGSWLQLAPLQDYTAATAHSMQPVPIAAKILTPDSGPRMTLPGPTLPPELARFQNANLVTVIGDATRTGKFRLPGWAVSFLVMLALLVIGVGVVFYFLPVAHSSAETQAPVVEGHGNASQPAVPPLPSQPAAHPLAQFVEVTGFRIVVDFNKKSEIHYLVVNHSGADLSDVTVYVTLRTAGAKPGQPPVCRFSFRAPSLGPFESKEMTSSIEKLTRATTLPEWQDLRPEVQIAQ